jgi:hypothetical protein
MTLPSETSCAVILGGAASVADREVHAAAAVAQCLDCSDPSRRPAIFSVKLRTKQRSAPAERFLRTLDLRADRSGHMNEDEGGKVDAPEALASPPPPSPRLASAVARRARESEPLVFICSGACASALCFKRASAAEHHNYTRRCSLFPVNRHRHRHCPPSRLISS